MAKKKQGPQQSNAPLEKDDGTRWQVLLVETGRPAYYGEGTIRSKADQLSDGLAADSYLVQVL